MAELGERRLYTLREQLQVQYRHTQKAQNNERKAWESRKRVTSYVFHEVRVPLNTALLAAQNMEAGMIIDKEHEIDFRALEGSLSVMSNVLNDVLDFNRMDSGRFESASKPYAFHAVMRSLFIPLGLVAKARGLELVTDLDHNIDFVARRATLEAEGQHPADVSEQMKLFPDGDGIVQGDETRLRQIINNLASNAAKFTPSGGRITITTKLILPSDPFTEESVISSNATTYTENSLSTTRLSQHNLAHQKPVVAKELDRIVVRIEVADTGSGIRPSDMENCNLFSAFNQTELGRQQGGKGTGLGLALVRNIVKLSGGRLGVKSVYGQGATFWVEMPLGVGMAAKPPMSSYDMVVQQMQQDNDRAATDSPTNGTNGGDSMSVSAEASVTRSTSAINGLMDQGGRVELMLSNHQYSTRQLGEMTAGLANPSHTIHEEDIGDHHQANTPDESSLTTASKQQRPTFVQLPGPNNFALEPSSTPSSSSDSPCDLPPGVSIYGMIGAAVAPTNGGGSSSSWRGSNGTSSSSATSPFEGLEVLVVDDDLMTRMMMNRLLTRLGCRVTLAENGQVALDLITAPPPPASPLSIEETPILETPTTTYDGPSRFAIVFLDNQMPVMHGILAVRNLRRLRGRKDFVVGVTGNALLVDQEEYLQAGVDHVLTKPVREPSLKSMLMIADERQKNALAQPDP